MADPRPGVSDTATVFTHGDGQAVRLPAGYRFDTDEVLIWRDGERVVLEPLPQRARSREDIEAMWARIDALGDPDDPFPEPPPQTISPIKTWDD